MKLLASFIGTAALIVSIQASAEDDNGVEAAFATCLAVKQPALIASILDAESQESFEAAMKSALEICPTENEKLSMGKLFRALAAAKTEISDGS